MTRRVLITGGAGFIGSHVADLFVAKGWSVEIIDNLTSGKRENVPPAAKLRVLDIRSPDAAELVAFAGFDALIHLAAQMDVRRSVADPLFDASVNIVGTLNLLEAIRQSAARPRVVFASTGGAVYGDSAVPPSSETTQKEPDSPYAIAKLSAEYYLSYYARIHGLDTASVRFGNVYGPRQDPHGEAGVVAIFCGRIIDGQPLRVFGDGTQTRDYVHVSDVADATFAAATTQLPPARRVDERAFNIGTGVATSVLELAKTLCGAAGAESKIEFAPKRPGEQQHSFLSVEKARDVLGWSPRITLEQGLADTYNWFAARRTAASSSLT
ncbi:MAG TPA: NAD-dependent epimerase/dehydratase family protein [Gemmatimonadaceae bacterium]|jgi:UDP-glucose 4-epimerase|nr:NAD-dependent epimerase/dehydratase family protein [Gemmatimonadaceae bacterium]